MPECKYCNISISKGIICTVCNAVERTYTNRLIDSIYLDFQCEFPEQQFKIKDILVKYKRK